jgi:phosphoenolpyruvate synthase/pyruvate phosphate dikinase
MSYDYNSSRKKLILPEYGRNIQKMVNHIKTIEDREERNKAAKTVIGVMGNLNPHLRDVADFKHKLWDHLAIISDFELDIDSPYETPKKESLQSKPKKVPYQQHKISKKHYGRSIVLMIEKAVALEPGEERDDLVKMIAYHMKKSYLTWNREAVSDEEIFNDMRTLSGGVLEVNPELKLPETKDILAKNRPSAKKKNGGKKKHHHHKQN